MNEDNFERLSGAWRASRGYVFALLIFCASRAVVLLALVFARDSIPRNPAGTFWDATPSWYRYLLRFDSGWYLRIIKQGYSYDGNDLVEHPVVFFPLYPLVSKALMLVPGIGPELSVILVSNAAVLLAVPLLFRLVRDDYGDETAFYAIALLSFFPTSFFFSAGYTESLALLLVTGFLLCLRKGWLLGAAACCGLAMATRAACVVLLPPLLWELWRAYKDEPKRLVMIGAACVVLATSGLWLYMLFLWREFNSPLAFVKGQRAWLAGGGVSSNFFQVLTLQPMRHLLDLFREGPTTIALDP
ncbi:MAG TPA: glycosyltransferase family 39 protein, partial [Pyrinomonadaceae bacterium]